MIDPLKHHVPALHNICNVADLLADLVADARSLEEASVMVGYAVSVCHEARVATEERYRIDNGHLVGKEGDPRPVDPRYLPRFIREHLETPSIREILRSATLSMS